MDILTDSRPISRLEIVDTGRRRRWPDETKVRIVEESLSGPRLASATARRHGIEPTIVRLPGIGLDIDHPVDLRAFLRARPRVATRTLALLEALGL